MLEFTITEDAYHLLWVDQALTAAQIKAESPSTKVNHFPEITQITRKNKLANNLNDMKIFFPKVIAILCRITVFILKLGSFPKIIIQ
jgi:hypothetical protein